MYKKYIIFVLASCLIINAIAMLSGCDSGEDSVKETLEKMRSHPINLCLNKMQCRIQAVDTVIVDSVEPDLRLLYMSILQNVLLVHWTECICGMIL